ncbi:CvpA family protein [Clostridiaceae bacterium M8S5]|nr:CvpA family protein [Clostridiaceae bacterium M8S5]
MNALDIIILALLLYSMIAGYCKGFVSEVFKLTGFIIAILITKKFYSNMAVLIAKNEKIYSAVYNFASKKSNALIAKMLDGSNVFDNVNLPSQVKNSIASNSSVVGGAGLNTGSELTLILTNLIINVISILLVFIIIKIVLHIVFKAIEGFTEIPGIKQLNQLMGMILGVVKGGLFISFMFVILSPFISISTDGWLSKLMEGSVIGNFFYSNNIILYLINDLHIAKVLDYLG